MRSKTITIVQQAPSSETEEAVRQLFDSEYYLRRYADVGDSGMDTLQHFLSIGRLEGRSPHPLFDARHYRAQIGERLETRDLFTHYLKNGGVAGGLSPHPLFDTKYYAARVGNSRQMDNPLLDYVTLGWRQGLSPHPLFDPAYYFQMSGLELDDIDPLTHYLAQSKFAFAPHYLFSDAVYVAELGLKLGPREKEAYRAGPPLLHYVLHGHAHEPKTHPLFDPAVYKANLNLEIARTGNAELQRSIETAFDLLRHYVEVGAALGISPTPYFDRDFYLSQIQAPVVGDPLRHYLAPGGFDRASPHPGIDLEYYSSRAGFDPSEMPAILHLLSQPQQDRISTHPAFDSERYKSTYDDIGRAGTCSILHFLAHGVAEDRSPNEYFSSEYVYRSDKLCNFARESAVHRYLAKSKPGRRRLIVVSHDASLTGAPGTALRLAEDFSRLDNVECFAIIGRNGPRVRDFQKVAHTLVLNTPFHSAHPEQLRRAVQQLLTITNGNQPVAAIVNSAESRAIIPELARAGIPVITLVHEAADLYPAGAFQPITEHSSKIVFGSQYVYDRASNVTALPRSRAMVRGQGLQQDFVGTMNRESARRLVLRELNLRENTYLVLGCGSVDYRKGADLFVASALDFLRRKPAGLEACFVWVGQGDGGMLNAFISNAIRGEGRDADIRFIGSRNDVEPYFVAADTFLMTSRVDPFPCVCQEAMASGLPIVAFAEGGGTIEMIGDEAGVCVPLGDTAAMSSQLLALAADKKLRQRLGNRGREIVREKWRPSDYLAFMAGLVAEVAGMPVQSLGLQETDDERGRVFVLLDDWAPSPYLDALETLVRDLNGCGTPAEIVFTRGRFSGAATAGASRHMSVPHRFLQPSQTEFRNGRWRTAAQEVLSELQRFARQMQPCVFLAADDVLASTLAPLLPSTVAIVGFLSQEDAASVDEMYLLGPRLDAIVALSQPTAQRLLELNPGLGERTAVIPPSTSGASVTSPGRDLLYVRVDLSNKAATAELLGLSRSLERSGIALKIVAHTDRLARGESRVKAAAAAGLSPAQLLVGASGSEVGAALDRAVFAVFLQSDRSALALLPEAASRGSRVIALNPSDALTDALGNGAAGLAVRGAVDAIAVAIRGAAPRSDLASATAAARAWLASRDWTPKAVASCYSALAEQLLAGLRQSGSSRPLVLPHQGELSLVWPARIRPLAPSDVSFPPDSV